MAIISSLDHSFLLKGEEPPVCIGCDKRLTREHILITWSDVIEIRESHLTAKSLRMLFKDISPEKIFYFLKEINIFRIFFKSEIVFSYVCVFTI